MCTYEIYSKRQKKLRGEVPDVYTYDELPEPLRVQIIHIWNDTLGDDVVILNSRSRTAYQNSYISNYKSPYKDIINMLRREYGVFKLLTKESRVSYYQELANFFLQEKNIDRLLDVVELSFLTIDSSFRDKVSYKGDSSKRADNAIKELNARFLEHGVGYQFSDGQIIRIDSELIHSEVTKPALRILNQDKYAGAQAEFLKAHEYYRNGDTEGALIECCKSFESLMKAICEKRGWKYDKKAAAKNLIKTCLDNGLIPSFWQAHITSLQSLLESSIPPARNKLAAHGDGPSPTAVPQYLAAYMLHMTASTIVFLDSAEEALP